MIETRDENGYVARFDSYGEYLAHCGKLLSDGLIAKRWTRYDSWAGGSYRDCLNMAVSGDESHVVAAEKLLEQISVQSNETPVAEWVSSPCGAYPIVPEALAGFPEPMRQLWHVPRENAPLNIYVNTVMSGGLSHEVILKRGVAILALVLKLQAIRPVTLYVTIEMGGYQGDIRHLIPMDSQPLNISAVANALCNTGWTRGLGYGTADVLRTGGITGGWPTGYKGERDTASYTKKVRPILGMGQDDIYVPPAYLTDPIITNPVEWVNQRLKDALGGMVDD